MLAQIWQNLSWLDILMLGVIIRILYIGYNTGIITEFFKVAAAVSSVFITFHYYTGLGTFLHKTINVSTIQFDTLAFVLLWGIVLFTFKLIRDGFLMLLRVEAHPFFDRVAGLLLAIVRGGLVCSMLFVLCSVSSSEYLSNNAKRSLVRPYLMNLAPNLYRGLYEGVVSKFFPAERLNTEVFKLRNSDQSK